MQRLRFAIVAATLVTAALGAPVAEELAIGASGPSFNLKGTDGQMHSLDQVKGAKGTAVIFTCNECPYSKGYEDRLIALAKDYHAKGIGFVAINANDPTIVPGDAYEFMITRAKDKGFPFPYLHDESQAIATAYGAKVTPHIYLLDASGKLVYRGRVDNSVKVDEVKERDFATAMDALVAGQAIPVAETKAFGCSIKWKKQG